MFGAAPTGAGQLGNSILINGQQVVGPHLNLSAWTECVWIDIPSAYANQGGHSITQGRQDNSNGDQGGFDVNYNDTNHGLTVQVAGSNGGGPTWLVYPTFPLTLTPNTWYQIEISVTQGQMITYVNGSEIGFAAMDPTYTPVFSPADALLTVGGGSELLSDFQLFSTALTPAQIASVYAGGATQVGLFSPTSPVQVAGGAVLDIGGVNQTVASLADNGPAGGGIVTNNGPTAATLTLAPAGGSTTFSGVISNGAGGTSQLALTLNGLGATQVLTGSSTYSGVTTVSGGTLQLGNGTNVGSINDSSAVVTGAGGILAFNHSDNVVFPLPISGSGGIQQMGPGVLNFGMPASYTGPTVITGGTLQASTYNFESVVPGVVAHYTFNQPTGSISDGQVMPNAAGTSYVMYNRGGGNFVTGGINGGNAVAFNGNFFLVGGYNPGYGTGQPTPFPTMNTWTTSEWFQLSSAALNTAHTEDLVGEWGNNGQGANLIRYYTAGSNYFAVWLGDGSGGWPLNQTNFAYTLTPGTWYNVTETVGNGVMDLYVNGALAGSAIVNGTPVFEASDQDFCIGYDDWSGGASSGLMVDDTLIVNHALTAAQVNQLYTGTVNTLPSTTPVQMGAGVLDLAGVTQTIASLADVIGGGTGTVTSSVAGAVTLTLAPPSSSTTTFSGVIQDGLGTMALVVNGPGTQVLAGVNTYSGGTTIQNGVLSISNDYNLGSTSGAAQGAVAITGGTLQATGAVTLNPIRPLSVGPAAGIDIPNGSSLVIAGTITNAGLSTGNLTMTGANGGGVLQLDGTASYSGLTTISAGTLSGTGALFGPVTIAAGAHLAPGDNTISGFSGFSTLTMGSLTLASNSYLDVNVSPNLNDEVAVSGVLSVGSGLTLDINIPGLYPPTPGYRYTLITTTEGIQGFSGNPFTVVGLPGNESGSVSVYGDNLVFSVAGVQHVGWYRLPELEHHGAELVQRQRIVCRRRRGRLRQHRHRQQQRQRGRQRAGRAVEGDVPELLRDLHLVRQRCDPRRCAWPDGVDDGGRRRPVEHEHVDQHVLGRHQLEERRAANRRRRRHQQRRARERSAGRRANHPQRRHPAGRRRPPRRPHRAQRRPDQRRRHAGQCRRHGPDLRPLEQLGDVGLAQYHHHPGLADDHRPGADDLRRRGIRQPERGGSQHPDPHRGHQWPDRHHDGRRRLVAGHGGQHRHAGGLGQRRQRDLHANGR